MVTRIMVKTKGGARLHRCLLADSVVFVGLILQERLLGQQAASLREAEGDSDQGGG
jgi:hypothetical protein